MTTKSHVFTIYGTIRGQYNEDFSDAAATAASRREVDQRAIRFQTTVDRLPMLFGAGRPERIGSQVIGSYADVRSE